MFFIKMIFLILIFVASTFLGMKISKKYSSRVQELKEFQNALNIFEEKIKFTYEPIPDVFKEISEVSQNNVGQVFENASINMKLMTAGEAWEKAIDDSNTKLTKDDKDILNGLAKMLGRTDLDGQVSEIRLTKKFLETKIKEAEIEKSKNEKLYKTLGATVGLAIVIILV